MGPEESDYLSARGSRCRGDIPEGPT